MNFKDYSAEIAKKANVNEPQARRVMQALFADVKGKLDKGQNVALPTVGRLINQKRPDGGNRVILTRPNPKPAAKAASKAKAKSDPSVAKKKV